MKELLRYILPTLLLLAGLAGCTDELPYDGGDIPEGEAAVNATVFFRDFAGARLGSRSPGDAVKQVENLCVLLYDNNGELRHSFYGTTSDKGTFERLTIDQTGNSDRPADGETSAESRTPSIDIRFGEVPNGRYRVYAVANMGDVARDTRYAAAAQTIDGLRSIRLAWQSAGTAAGDSIARDTNNQMLGYFSEDGAAEGFEAPLVTLNKQTTLFAWLRRAASKVTVAYDGSRLADNITIYLQSVEIKDIPTGCLLGRDNTPAADSEITQGEKIMYSTDTDYHNWPAVTAGRRKTYGLPAPGLTQDDDSRLDIDQYHGEECPALYFYENIQGTGKDKRQDYTGDNRLDNPGFPGDPHYSLKDDKPYGTYIEVTAYYRSRSGEGKIIYRFMLGKDVLTDYNAERNFHYKLTLVFNGNANDVDWHIEYKQEKEMLFPDPYYISYLYNQDMMLPVTLKGNDFSNDKLRARVIESNWAPDGYGPEIEVVTPGTEKNSGPWHGFLSLTKNTDPVIGQLQHYQTNDTWNKEYWTSRPQMGTREYTDLSLGPHPDNSIGGYSCELNDSSDMVVNIPFFTRNKQMVPTTGYTGNNPFDAYQRKALVEITLLDKTTGAVINDAQGRPLRDTLTIYQVRRLENPKGIWRSYDKDDAFHVVLQERKSEGTPRFTPVASDGPWRVSVEQGKDWVMINGKVNGTAQGGHDTYIDFTYKPAGVLADSTATRCGIILVEYNDYTCHHRIFVRQGMAPMRMNNGNVLWHTYNLYSETAETLSPLEGGSLFKHGNLDDGILASNDDVYGIREAVSGDLRLSNGSSKSWSAIKSQDKKQGTANITVSFPDLTLAHVTGRGTNIKARLASADDFNALQGNADNEYAYGVLYGDGATQCAADTTAAYQYKRGGASTNGMRGCFVYDSTNGDNIFFPVGATGMGKRGTDQEWYGADWHPAGMLNYAWRHELYKDREQVLYRPLFNDVYRRPGAIYWTQSFTRSGTGAAQHAYLDINYFTFEFTVGADEPLANYGKEADQTETAACMIRCVEDVQ